MKNKSLMLGFEFNPVQWQMQWEKTDFFFIAQFGPLRLMVIW